MIFVIKVTTNKEDKTVEMIGERAEKKQLDIYSVLHPHGLRGYIFIEAENRESVEEAVFNLPYIKGIASKTIDYEKIKNMVEPTITNVTIKEGDIVEIIGQTLKGEKAKVTKIDLQKQEAVVSLLGAVVPLPITVKLDNIRVVRRDENAN